jgi:hypothetical protein
VHEYIFPTFAGNKAITFGSIEPLDRTDDPFRHLFASYSKTFNELGLFIRSFGAVKKRQPWSFRLGLSFYIQQELLSILRE